VKTRAFQLPLCITCIIVLHRALSWPRRLTTGLDRLGEEVLPPFKNERFQ
jgi:hypothetical protein